MEHPEEEWACRMCGFRVWRYVLAKEKGEKRIEFLHSKIHEDGSDPRCVGHLTRTGRWRPEHLDDVHDSITQRNKHPRIHFNDNYWKPVKAEEVPIGEEI